MNLPAAKIAGPKRSKKSKAPDRRPARARYWASGRLPFRKVRNLMRSGYAFNAALSLWETTRKRGRPKMVMNYKLLHKLDR